jgi:hypothetical protein
VTPVTSLVYDWAILFAREWKTIERSMIGDL